jgi:hypothetical protein
MKDYIVASYISGVYDVNRNTVLADDDYSIIQDWANSISKLKLQGIIFHNNCSVATCERCQNEYITFIKIDHDVQFNPNVYRYCIYNEFLKLNSEFINNIFFTDISDVIVLKNPFLEQLYIDNPTSIFCGDEPKILNNEWMQQHSENLRNNILDYKMYEYNFANSVLLNCGIMGGNITIMKHFIKKLWNIHQKYNSDNKTAFTGDMGAFNYLIRTQYNNKVIHGKPVNTEFKKYLENTVCWFKHK